MPHAYTYDEEFYEYIRSGASSTARRLVPFIVRELNVKSVLDVGCGAGAWIAEYLKLGIAPSLGVDGDYVSRESLLVPADCFQARDISQPFDLARPFDLVQCLEVGEHLPTEASATLVENLVRHSKLVLFSAAPPGQGGENHINEQTYEFWRKLFALHGYKPFDFVRPFLGNLAETEPWYRYNILLYVENSATAGLPSSVKQTGIDDDLRIPDIAPLGFRVRKQILRHLSPTIVTLLAEMKHKWMLAIR